MTLINHPLKSSIIQSDWFMVVCLDGHEPQLAPLVCETIAEQEEETLVVMLRFACWRAWEEVGKRTQWN